MSGINRRTWFWPGRYCWKNWSKATIKVRAPWLLLASQT
jgi:hypothetical protein